VEVVEHVLVEQVRLIEEEDRMAPLGSELLDVASDLVEDGGRRRLRIEPECEADVAIEVSPSERRVVAVR
jgi:hypothetical protein